MGGSYSSPSRFLDDVSNQNHAIAGWGEGETDDLPYFYAYFYL